MTVVGFFACIVPGMYLAVASSLVVPFAVFDRGSNAIAGSFRAVNRNFGAVLGRLVVATLLVLAVSLAISCVLGGIFGAASQFDTSSGSTATPAVDTIGSSIITSIVGLPLTMFFLAAILAIYAQVRARAVPTTSADLNAALGA
jgi:hypothetical protein